MFRISDLRLGRVGIQQKARQPRGGDEVVLGALQLLPAPANASDDVGNEKLSIRGRSRDGIRSVEAMTMTNVVMVGHASARQPHDYGRHGVLIGIFGLNWLLVSGWTVVA